jgi:hypothetical protein
MADVMIGDTLNTMVDASDVAAYYGTDGKVVSTERGGNGYAQPTATAPHLDSTRKRHRKSEAGRWEKENFSPSRRLPPGAPEYAICGATLEIGGVATSLAARARACGARGYPGSRYLSTSTRIA